MEIQKDVETFVSLVRLGAETNDVSREIFNKYFKTKRMTEFNKEFKKQLEQYMYLLTFTRKPTCKKSEDDTQYYIKTILTNNLSIIKACMSVEHCETGARHWHAAVIAKRKLTKKKDFGHYSKSYGFVDVNRNKTDNFNTMIDYISKESKPITLKPP